MYVSVGGRKKKECLYMCEGQRQIVCAEKEKPCEKERDTVCVKERDTAFEKEREECVGDRESMSV